MNIRVDLNYPIKDGTEVVFRSPVDCSQITGLKIYYPGASHEFIFADAHGNNVGDIDHLFAENVVVKVILDVTTGMAFVQNADTNAYIERTFVKSVNLQTPDENGNVRIETGGAGDVYMVRCSYDSEDNPYIIGEFNWNNMETAYKNGCPVFLQISDAVEIDGTFPSDASVAMYSIYYLDFADGMAFFRMVNATNTSLITIYDNGRIERTNTSNLDDTLTKNMPANAKSVGDALGDISTALDSIIAMQEELIGV